MTPYFKVLTIYLMALHMLYIIQLHFLFILGLVDYGQPSCSSPPVGAGGVLP